MTEKDFEHSKIPLEIINIILKHSSRRRWNIKTAHIEKGDKNGKFYTNSARI